MYRLLAALALAVSAAPAFAADADPPKPNTLTAKEIADGWVLLFDGETTFGWKIDGPAEVKNGALVLGGDKTTTATLTSTFGDYEARMEAGGTGSIVLGAATTRCNVELHKQMSLVTLKVVVTGPRGVSGTTIQSETSTRPEGTQTTIKATTNVPAELRLVVPAGGTLTVKSMKRKSGNSVPLFTGKGLDGWKVNTADPKRAASKWEVTKDGELSVKNGPGDLVTEKEFDNFVLQFECKTLGKALNSGIFFRCIPGQYQNGYEAQVQNAYKDGDRTKPADFGTGAIYRRVPARKVVSNDNEWFTMTVAANGRRISTWVNGYQTVDWLDDRKESDNPRQGFRAAKGPLSIQGHDPTTDILFRNIRIAPLP
ncbi:DUF1080 domain-containing protein [Gemmata sp. JC673]|uniref:DUF1080 domain-containing protein n=1 Tax=Gemmata algarum TaxID=2975278 RepID=A0ABU5ESC7_9BACT|nr:DUF1080 domain-containing protein [Gemmata algarum]MDY3558050.1 DUF1080 domain-containing protein [Gemmata algarum]